MSIIDTLNHSVVAYVAGSTKPFAGQRLAKVTYKTVTDKDSALCGIKRESKCVSIPMIPASDVIGNVQVLAPYLIEYLQGVQDKIVRESIDAGSLSISMESIGISGICEWLESNNESGRLTKDSVASWFNENIAETLAVILADKLGVSETPTNAESAQIMKVVDTYKDKISALAGGKTSYDPKMCESLKKALSMAPDGDVLKGRFVARLDKMIAESMKGIDLMDLL